MNCGNPNPCRNWVNEHGSCVGIVELMDILEKVVGEIAANRKRDMPRVEQLSNNEWHIDARVLISEVNMALDTQIPTDQCDTIGGFILLLLGRLPQTGEKVEYEDFEFNIDQVFQISYFWYPSYEKNCKKNSAIKRLK